ncbi:MAG: hypothetical protein RIE58_06070 [Vicingaceae bacterium]
MGKPKITYLFGAGASFPTLPLSANYEDDKKNSHPGLTEDLLALVGNLHNNQYGFADRQDAEIIPRINQQILKLLKNVGDSAKNFQNIDTYAKYLYHSIPSEFDNVKRAISIYFILKQYIFLQENKIAFNKSRYPIINPKYKNFLISIIDKDHTIPERIKMLNWNYDFQIEAADRTLFHDIGYVKSYPLCLASEIENIQPNLIHLNGISGASFIQNAINPIEFVTVSVQKLFETIESILNDSPLIKFAWEKEQYVNPIGSSIELINKVKQMITRTEILVVIGYSFPFFNREIDNEIIDTMTHSGLKKIYFQSPELDGQFLFSQFDLDIYKNAGYKIEHIKNCTQFFIPHEL